MKATNLVTLLFVLSIVGCASSLTYVNRESSEIGTGTADGVLQKLTANFPNKTCEGEYTTVAQGGGFGLLNAYGTSGFATGTSAWLSVGGVAFGILKCSDGDVLRCEVQYSGTAGYGVCVGKDNTAYDVMAR